MPRLFAMPLMAAAFAAAALSGCSRGSGGATQVVIIGDHEPELGDPLRPPASEGDALLRMATAQGLVRFDAGGQIEPGLAERWNVSDDGLSYIFRLSNGSWPDGRKIMARDIARLLTRQLKSGIPDPTRDALGAVDEAVAMTDRVIEIRLRSPRPNLLTLLAQPEFALIREGVGSGPFKLREPDKGAADADEAAPLRLRRRLPGADGEEGEREDVELLTLPAAKAVAAFRDDRAAILLGGRVADLPLATAARLPRGTLRFDPVAGLFGLAPARKDGPAGDPAVRRLLSEAIDRQALIARLAVPGLDPRATLLQGGLDGLGVPPQPAWLSQPVAERRDALAAASRSLRPAKPSEGEKVQLAIAIPEGPGNDLILRQLNADWSPLGFTVERAGKGQRADFRWIDEVAPSDSPAWFLRRFRCAVAPVCLAQADEMLDSARETQISAQRAGLFAEASRLMDEEQLFIPVAAPIRWSLVARNIAGFTENRYARHPIGGLSVRSRFGGSQ